MSKTKEQKKQKLNKKVINMEIREKISGVLSNFKEDLGEKIFDTRIKKASRLISRGIKKLRKKNAQNKITIQRAISVPAYEMKQKEESS